MRFSSSSPRVPEPHKISGIEQSWAWSRALMPLLVYWRDHLKFVYSPMFLIAHFFLGESVQPVTALVFPPFGGPAIFFLILRLIASQYS